MKTFFQFFQAYGICDYPYNVDCQGAPTPRPPPTPRPETPSPTPGVSPSPVTPQQPDQPRPQPPAVTFPPGAYPQPQWSFRSHIDPWNQRPTAGQIEVDNQENLYNDPSGLEGTTEPPTVLNPWGTMHTIPEELMKLPCETGKVHRLDDACTSVVVCKNSRPQLIQCDEGLSYDRPSDSCRHFTVAKW